MRLELAELPALEPGEYAWTMPITGTPTVPISAEAIRTFAAIGVVFPGAKVVKRRCLR